MEIDLLNLEKKLGIPAIYFEKIDSTNLYCKDKIKSGTPFEGVVIAAEQSRGQGRIGKSFYSPKESGLYLTFCLKADRFSQKYFTPAIALAVCRGIEQVFSVSCGVKWVNDIYFQNRKISGVLCQNIDGYLLIGIGINLTKPETIPQDLQNRLGWIKDKILETDKADLILALYKNILEFCGDPAADMHKEYVRRCIHIGSSVHIEHNGTVLNGRCVGIDENFELLLETNGETRAYSSGYMTLSI